MQIAATELRWGVERRLEFIEFRLYWEGGINRADIMEQFGVSVPQASKDLSLYQELAPGNMTYDKSDRRYVTASNFQPRFLAPDPDHFLNQLRSVAEHTAALEDTWLSVLPNLDFLPTPHRRVDPEMLRSLLAAIHTKRAVEILYQSMNPVRPDPVWRGISPHALGSDGFRWHVRAFCHIDRKFKDFLLSRCMKSRPAGDVQCSPEDDHQWQQLIEVRLRPNPKLSKSQQQVIADDYGMKDGMLVVRVRKSLLYYFQKRLRLDVAEALDNPFEAPVVVANRAAFDKALSGS